MPIYRPYLRFKQVKLNFYGLKPIEEKREIIKRILLTFVLAIKDSMFEFHGRIYRKEGTDFRDHLELCDYFKDELLPICSNCREYEFDVSFWSDVDGATNLMSSMLQIETLVRCPNVKFGLWCIDRPTRLPIESIEDWLTSNGEENKPEERLLRMEMSNISNGDEIFERLQKVLF